MSHVNRETPVQHSRAPYYRWWRTWTTYNWREANRQSRLRHIAERREYDRKRYLRRRIAQLMERQQHVEEWLVSHGLGD
jgi:hypothetical protein